MYSKEEAAKLRQQFWISFGQYMKPVPATDGYPVNWINYKTGVKHVFIKMDVNTKKAIISIQLTHTDEGIRELFFNQFEEFKTLFASSMGEQWHWMQDATDEYGKTVSRISTTLENVNIYNKQDWPELISFFKPRLIALDEFWDNVKPVFQNLS
ncbi:DUF4268 domain-containing protein [Pedobacter sp. Leaf194]|uniref:DUF4268 domain-containing protein n=1 Tax=Pedobacter sp. Leaf194 TaxID=1736297 RepID=UPI0007038361|nr:DUF4268 domain-containing protein [Pedobacter sp. Leaf194]KQS36036.1 hypothetical protein ASG14_11395 [Pedobacter sp. Leaf194]